MESKQELEPIYSVSETSKRLFDAKDQQRKIKEREEERLKNEMRECTFAPKTNITRQVKSKIKYKEVGERLYKSAEKIKETKEKLKKKIEKENKETYTFKPRVNPHKSISSQSKDKKVFDRLASSNKRDRLRKLEMQKAENELKNCTFAPSLSKKSSKYDERTPKDSPSRVLKPKKINHEGSKAKDNRKLFSTNGRNDSGVFDRLTRDNSDREFKRAELNKKKVEKDLKDCTFDAKKTIQKIREEQKVKQQQLQKQRLEVQVSNLRGTIAAPKSSLEVGPSCFQQALSLVRFSAKTLTKPETNQIEDNSQEENNATVDNQT